MLRNNVVCRHAHISSLGYLWFHVSCNAMQGTWRSTRDMRYNQVERNSGVPGKKKNFFSIKLEIGIFVVD